MSTSLSEAALLPDPERQRVYALLRRFGLGVASFQTLGPDFRYWFYGDDACLAYLDTGSAWVVGGLPLAAVDRYNELIQAFQKDARAHGRRVSYVTLDPRFAAAAGLDTICFGEIPIWNPQHWEQTVRGSRSLREQFRRARAKGVRTRLLTTAEVEDASGPVRKAMVAIVTVWLRSRRAPPLRFIARVEPFFLIPDRRYLAAEWNGQLIAFLVAVPAYARNGWMIETIFRAPGKTPNGVSELLVDAAMRSFAESGATYATLGAAPLTDRVNVWLRIGRFLGSRLYNFKGLYTFKAKLKPERWEPIHIAYAHGGSSILAFWDVAMAFSPADKPALALSVLRRYRQPIIRVMLILLIPWTLLLAGIDTTRWFPSETVQWGWVAFDVLLIVLFARLFQRHGPVLATCLAVLTSIDSLLTAWQAALYNIPRARTAIDAIGIATAVIGPILVTAFLWLTLQDAPAARDDTAAGVPVTT